MEWQLMQLCDTHLAENPPELVAWNRLLFKEEVNNLVHGHTIFPAAQSADKSD